jgi:hypothetical protein
MTELEQMPDAELSELLTDLADLNTDDTTVDALKEANRRLAARLPGREDAPCALCGELTNSFAGNGALWPVWFCHADGTGISRPHHQKCISRLIPVGSSEQKK